MRNNLLVVLFVAFVFTSCEQLSKLTQFDMPFTASVTIPKSTPINLPFNLPTPEIETNSASFFSSKNVNTDLIDKITLKKLELSVTSPTNGNFNFLKTIEIYISADGLNDVKIASLENIPSNSAMPLQLNVDTLNLKPYILKDKFALKVNATTDELITTDYEVDVKTTFFVDAKIAGL
ncbi:MAG: hypothetical protein QM800_00910 [Paludibacter sp.]